MKIGQMCFSSCSSSFCRPFFSCPFSCCPYSCCPSSSSYSSSPIPSPLLQPLPLGATEVNLSKTNSPRLQSPPPPGRRVPPNRRNTNHPEKDRSIKSFWCVTVCSTLYLVEDDEKGVTLASVHAAQPRSSSSISTKSLNVVSGGVNKEPHLHSNHKLLSRCDGSQPRLISDSNDLRGPVAQGQPQGRPTYLLRKPPLKVQIPPPE